MSHMQLGKAIGILYNLFQREMDAHSDVSLWGAPSECHTDVSRMFEDEYKKAIKQINGGGWTIKKINDEATARGISGRWMYYNFNILN